MEYLPYYLLTGACTGVLSGLLGIGGGLVIVPVLAMVFATAAFPADYVMQMALGTSLATIVPTSISSMRAHHRYQAVNWALVQRISPGIVAGTLFGAWLAGQLATRPLKLIFVVFAFAVSVQMLLDARPKPSRQLPGGATTNAVGMGIGLLSSMVGIGGGSLSVPFMVFCNVPVRMAVGTSSAIGLPIALAGMAGYTWAGVGVVGLPSWSVGFVYLPALIGVSLASVVMAPFGARLAHRLPVARLKKLFAMLLLILGLKMAWGLF